MIKHIETPFLHLEIKDGSGMALIKDVIAALEEI